MEIRWHTLTVGSPLVGHTLAEANLRARTGASVVALVRAGQLVANPKSHTMFAAHDIVGLIGDADDLAAVDQFIRPQMEQPTATAMDIADVAHSTPA
jgi:CPA2 family monovalent cation:H+ antiporter-2